MNKKLQVFVSSTYTDLIEERQAAVEAILDAGHIPAGMELFKAGKSQMKTIHKWIDESDVYILILGGRYGSIESKSGLSYTELEYRYALSKNVPVFSIVLNDSFLFTKAAFMGKDAIFEKDNAEKYDNFKSYVKSSIVLFAANIDSLKLQVQKQLSTILDDKDYNLIGWIRHPVKQIFINNQDLGTEFTSYLININLTLNKIKYHNGNIDFVDSANKLSQQINELKLFHDQNNYIFEKNNTCYEIIITLYNAFLSKLSEIIKYKNRELDSEDNIYIFKIIDVLYNYIYELIN